MYTHTYAENQQRIGDLVGVSDAYLIRRQLGNHRRYKRPQKKRKRKNRKEDYSNVYSNMGKKMKRKEQERTRVSALNVGGKGKVDIKDAQQNTHTTAPMITFTTTERDNMGANLCTKTASSINKKGNSSKESNIENNEGMEKDKEMKIYQVGLDSGLCKSHCGVDTDNNNNSLKQGHAISVKNDITAKDADVNSGSDDDSDNDSDSDDDAEEANIELIHRRFWLALILWDMVHEVPFERIGRKYKLMLGMYNIDRWLCYSCCM